KSSLVRPFTILPCLSRTVARTSTTLTWTDIVVSGWSSVTSTAGLLAEAAVWDPLSCEAAAVVLVDALPADWARTIPAVAATAMLKRAKCQRRNFTGWAFLHSFDGNA